MESEIEIKIDNNYMKDQMNQIREMFWVFKKNPCRLLAGSVLVRLNSFFVHLCYVIYKERIVACCNYL